MGKKTSLYALKKRQREQKADSDTQWLQTLAASRPFGEDADIIPGMQSSAGMAATKLLLEVRGALDAMILHTEPPNSGKSYNCLAYAVDVAAIRAAQIDQENSAGQLFVTQAAKDAMLAIRGRWERLGRWGTNAQEREALAAAIDLYEVILMSSSPKQMMDAENIRFDALKGKS